MREYKYGCSALSDKAGIKHCPICQQDFYPALQKTNISAICASGIF